MGPRRLSSADDGAASRVKPLSRGRYRLRLAADAQDLICAQQLRAHCFRKDQKQADRDAYDARADHFLIEQREDGALVGCFRTTFLQDGRRIAQTYTAQSYDLTRLQDYAAPMAELGRFCIAPGYNDPDILRIAWAGLTRYVDENHIEMLFGCASFSGTEPRSYRDVFALLNHEYLAPHDWRPGVRRGEIHDFRTVTPTNSDRRHALAAMPSLLRSYLTMGGRVSDHAVIDRVLNTLHIFIGLEISHIPESRKRLLRLIAAESGSDESA